MGYKILAINPGSTSTKVALYDGERPLFTLALRHSTEEISRFRNVIEQIDWRRSLILEALHNEQFALRDLDIVIGRGGLVRPIPSGVYEVNAQLRYDLRHSEKQHAANLGGLLAAQIAHMARTGIKAYIADPPVADELEDYARVTGMPMCRRRPIWHALNHKATARIHCAAHGMLYEESNFIIAHMGGGISVGAHRKGRIIDVNNALDGDGPFAPDRAGSIPSAELIKASFSGKYSEKELLQYVSSKGGLVAYLGTNSVIEVSQMVERGDHRAQLMRDAMCYNVCKQIGGLAAGLCGKVDGILLTGGIAYDKAITDYITEHCQFIAPVSVYPGENELDALMMNARDVLDGKIIPKIYK